MNPIDFSKKLAEKQAEDAEWKAVYEELCLYTTAEERGALAIAFFSGDEDRKKAAVQAILDRQNRERGEGA